MEILATIFKVAIDILCIYLIIYEVLRIFSISEMFSALSWSFFFCYLQLCVLQHTGKYNVYSHMYNCVHIPGNSVTLYLVKITIS